MYRNQQVVVHEEALVQQVQLKRSWLLCAPQKLFRYMKYFVQLTA